MSQKLSYFKLPTVSITLTTDTLGMNYWLDLFTPFTWTRFRDHGADISGFRPRQRKSAFERVKKGDLLLCYLVKLSRWCGVLEVTSEAFEDRSPIFADTEDPFTIRFHVKPRTLLDFEKAIPIDQPELWNYLSFTRDLEAGSFGWAQQAGMRQSLVQLREEDGRIISDAIARQGREQHVFPLDAADRRHSDIANRTIVRTEQGEVEVEVPERGEREQISDVAAPEARSSLKMQAKVAHLGAVLGFNIWVPASDRAKITELVPTNSQTRFVTTLPLNYDLTTLKTIENIDVIWLLRRSIVHAFEIEHTTAIYSGLLRMADLLALQPRMNIQLHIVAPSERRDQVRREIVRPVFSVMEGGSMADRCSFLSYEVVDQILAQPNLAHMRESILEDYEEFFDT
jgi:hypothetical protein